MHGLARTIALTSALLPAAAGADSFDPWNDAARYTIEYRVDLEALAESQARVWIPTPAETAHQRVLAREVESPWPTEWTRDAHGNRLVHLTTSGPAPETPEVVLRFEVERRPAGPVPTVDGDGADGRYLSPQRRIPLQGVIRKLAVQHGEGLAGPSEKIRAYYDYVVETMAYSKHGNGWGQGDAVWACTSRYGNCTDFHSLFIGMARSQGIPARFVIGFPIPADRAEGSVAGYHCWSEALDPERGWLPLDASEAKKSGRVDDYYGRLPSDRVEFTVGRDLELAPAQDGPPVNYLIYPYAEVGGEAVETVPWTLHFRREPAVPARPEAAPEEEA